MSNLFSEKLVSLLRQGDTKQHRNRYFIVIHENKVRSLVADDPFFSKVASEYEAELKKLHRQAKEVVEANKAKEKEKAEKAAAQLKERQQRAKEKAAAAAMAKKTEAEEKRKKLHKIKMKNAQAGKDFTEALVLASEQASEAEKASEGETGT